MAEVINPTPSHISKPSRLNFTWKSKVNLLVVALVIIAAVIGGLLWHRHNTQKSTTIPSTINGITAQSQNFTKTKLFTLSGAATGEGASYQKPLEFGGSTSGKLQAGAEQVTTNSSSEEIPLGEVYIQSGSVAQPFTSTYVQNYGKLMLAAATNQKDQVIFTSQATNQMPKGYKVKFDSVKAFTSPNIKGRAWEARLSATSTLTNNTTQSPQEGVLITALGQKTYYNFLFMVTNYNWNASQPAVNSVINSLKIDQ